MESVSFWVKQESPFSCYMRNDKSSVFYVTTNLYKLKEPYYAYHYDNYA